MKKNLLAFIIVLGLLVTQCSENILDNPIAVETGKSIKFSLSITPQMAKIAKKALLRISSTDMDTINVPLRISLSSIYGAVQNIPSGDNRLFEVFVFDSLSVLKYYGDTSSNIRSSKTTSIKLVLKRPDGTAVATGTIADNLHTNNYFIYTPSKPIIIDTTHATNTQSTPTITFSTYAYGSEQIEYNWELLKTDTSGHSVPIYSSDSSWSTDSTFTYKFTHDGTYTIFAKTMGFFHPDFEKETSQPVTFIIRNNQIILDIDTVYYKDLINFIDTIYFKDSINFIDTIYFKDSINYFDTIYFKDSINHIDTIYFKDLIYNIDTVYYNDSIDSISFIDTIYYIDSINHIDTVFYSNDSINYIDSVYFKDSINYFDTIYFKDSINYFDTIYYKDTINFIDTIYYKDTSNYIDNLGYKDSPQYGVSPSTQEIQLSINEIEPFPRRIRSFIISNFHTYMILEFS
jgi:hypothetical protein